MPTTNDKRIGLQASPAATPVKRWYFVCECGAKWFHVDQAYRCPRCGRRQTSTELLPVPWLNREQP
jgi:hypothetical protein